MSEPRQPKPGTKKARVLGFLRHNQDVSVYQLFLYCNVNNPPAWIGFLEADGWKIDRRSVNVGGCSITVYNLREEG